jgi:hypothetical protein
LAHNGIMEQEERPHEVLGVPPTATADEVRAAYRRLVRQYHPDLHVGDPDRERRAEEQMKVINAAYRALGDRARGLPPTTPVAKPPPRRPTVCPQHAADMVYQCPACGRRACVRCLVPAGCVRCRPSRRSSLVRRMPEALLLWPPLGGGFVLWREGLVAPSLAAWAALGYLAVLGAGSIRRLPRWGVLLWLGFPYTLVLTGLWRLFDSLA